MQPGRSQRGLQAAPAWSAACSREPQRRQKAEAWTDPPFRHLRFYGSLQIVFLETMPSQRPANIIKNCFISICYKDICQCRKHSRTVHERPKMHCFEAHPCTGRGRRGKAFPLAGTRRGGFRHTPFERGSAPQRPNRGAAFGRLFFIRIRPLRALPARPSPRMRAGVRAGLPGLPPLRLRLRSVQAGRSPSGPASLAGIPPAHRRGASQGCRRNPEVKRRKN